jgi:hypothetical protein
MDNVQGPGPDRKVEEARESLRAHAEELGRRFGDAKQMLDIPAKIAAHPQLAVGIAFVAGALLGFPGKRVRPSLPGADTAAKTGLMGAALATLGTLAFQLAKSVAFHHLSGQAKAWWDRQNDLAASHTRETESFLEH